MIQKAGYQEHTRMNGSKWYLCDYCEVIGFVTGDEQRIIEHVKKEHNIPKTLVTDGISKEKA